MTDTREEKMLRLLFESFRLIMSFETDDMDADESRALARLRSFLTNERDPRTAYGRKLSKRTTS